MRTIFVKPNYKMPDWNLSPTEVYEVDYINKKERMIYLKKDHGVKGYPASQFYEVAKTNRGTWITIADSIL